MVADGVTVSSVLNHRPVPRFRPSGSREVVRVAGGGRNSGSFRRRILGRQRSQGGLRWAVPGLAVSREEGR